MGLSWKKPEAELRNYYTLFIEIGVVVVLLIFLTATKLHIRQNKKEVDFTMEQEVVQMEEVVQTKQQQRPPPPPRPPVPVTVPNDAIIEDQVLDIDAELKFEERLEMPPPPKEETKKEEEEDFFVVVEQMPELKGGLANLQQCVKYPELARKAGIEGRVIVQFVVNEQGKVENPQIIRGIGGGADEEALRCVKLAEFQPGRQRGVPVRVQYSLPVVFRLQN